MNTPPRSDAAEAVSNPNWHPRVHQKFGERLYFYLVRFRQPLIAPVADQVRSLLKRADIRYACEYAVFGHWDALIRAWLSEVSSHRVLFVLDQEQQVQQVRHFETEHLRYLWAGTDDDLLLSSSDEFSPKIDALSDEIRAVAQSFEAPDPSAQALLIREGLLLSPPERVEGQVKFYWSLKSTSNNAEPVKDTRTLLRAVRDADIGTRASLYSGFGNFADYLIRCVAPSYADVLRITSQLDTHLGDLDVDRSTFLLANVDARESDNLNDPDLTGLTVNDARVLASDILNLGSDATSIFAGLPGDEREALHALLAKAHSISLGDKHLRARLRTLLRACLKNDRDEVTASLAFLLDTEFFLGEYLKRAWASLYGSDWIGHLSSSFAQRAETERYAAEIREPARWTLGPLIYMSRAAAELDPQADALLTADLGLQWKTQLSRLLETRNHIAHGQLWRIKRLDQFSAGDWAKTLTYILDDIAPLHGTLRNLQQVGDKNDS
jgi:hypothetical protein